MKKDPTSPGDLRNPAPGSADLLSRTQELAYSEAAKDQVACACCGSLTSVVACVGDRYNFGLRTVVCSRCGLIFTNPRPTRAWFETFYRLHYRAYYEEVVAPDEEYLGRDWVSGRHGRNVEWLRGVGLPQQGRLLDVGSAEGTFLRLFEDAFPRWQAEGIEPSPDFSASARSFYGLQNVTTGRLEDLESLPTASLDLITASHVLEHLLSPDWFFSAARQMLKPNGYLFIDVPDAESESRGIGNLHVAHVYHFSKASLDNFLARHGFETVISRKGLESPPWTLQILARRSARRPDDWQPPRVSARAIARSFRRYAGLDPGRSIRNVGGLLRRSVGRLVRGSSGQ